MTDKFEQISSQFNQTNDLDRFAFDFGSDKGTQVVNNLSAKSYTKVYYEYFQPIRDYELNIFEIGVFNGASVKMWNAFFPNAKIYALDINPECKKYENDRIKVFIGSQNDKNFLADTMKSIGSSIDIIIDDGSHKMSDHQISLEVLFPYLSPGGFYFIEDLHTAYWNEFGGGYGKKSNTVEYTKRIIDQINKNGIRSSFFSKKPQFVSTFDPAYSIAFFQSLLVIRKKFE